MIKQLVQLDRPLAIIDTETHAIVPPEQARIVDLGLRVVYPDDRPDRIFESLINPGVPILPEATAVHGITNEDVADKPRFKQYAKALLEHLNGADICGYNGRFDIRVTMGEFARNGFDWAIVGARIIDPLRLWQIAQPRSLTDAVREFLRREPGDAHRAGGDANDAYEVLCAMLQRFPETVLPRSFGRLHDLSFGDNVDIEGKFKWKNNDVVCTFGKHNGVALVRIAQVDRGYLTWLAGADFSGDVKRIANDALVGIFPQKVVDPGLKT